jgi:hypothetical protein
MRHWLQIGVYFAAGLLGYWLGQGTPIAPFAITAGMIAGLILAGAMSGAVRNHA